MWRYRTDIGTFWIRKNIAGEYELWLNEDLLGACGDAAEAARRVSNCTTGYSGWDCRGQVKEPQNLKGWAKFDIESEHKT